MLDTSPPRGSDFLDRARGKEGMLLGRDESDRFDIAGQALVASPMRNSNSKSENTRKPRTITCASICARTPPSGRYSR